MCLILFVAATVSFPKQKALITNFSDFSSIFLVPLLLRYAVKNQKNTRQLHRNPDIQTQKYNVKGNIRMSAIEVKNKNCQNQPQEMVTLIDKVTVKYSKRSEARNKNDSESNPDEIIVESVDKVIGEH